MHRLDLTLIIAIALAATIGACRSTGARAVEARQQGVGGVSAETTRAEASVGGVAMPRPAPPPMRAEASDVINARCERCHDEIAAEWRGSLHQMAHVDPVYQRAFQIEPMPFCQGCHAPETAADQGVPTALGAIGVGCVTCHVTTEDSILAIPLTNGGSNVLPRLREDTQAVDPDTGEVAHGVLRSGVFATAAACEACHEFAFPDRAARGGIELMQSTDREHKRSRYAAVSCAGCHMPHVPSRSGRPHRGHRFEASRDAKAIRGAVHIEAQRSGKTGVRLTLTPLSLGHAFPTGDLFRRLEVVVEAVGVDWQVHARGIRFLTRHFVDVRHGAKLLRQVDHDDRPLAEPVVIDMDLGDGALDVPLVWRVSYQRVEHPISEDPGDSVVEGEIEVASGSLLSIGPANRVSEKNRWAPFISWEQSHRGQRQ